MTTNPCIHSGLCRFSKEDDGDCFGNDYELPCLYYLSRPELRENLNKEVLAELEGINKMTEDISTHLINKDYLRGRSFGIGVAISLIKSGEKKG